MLADIHSSALSSELSSMLEAVVQGNLLDDTALVGVLANTKQTAEEVNERLAGASATNRKLTEACEVHTTARPLCLLQLSLCWGCHSSCLKDLEHGGTCNSVSLLSADWDR